MSPLRIKLLGQLRIARDEQCITSVNTSRLRSLLAYLVLHRDAPQPREYLAFLLWQDSEESQARTNLRQLLHHLRRALGHESFIHSDGSAIQWRADCCVDVEEFGKACLRASKAAGEADITAECLALEQAAELYQGDLLPDLYDDWLRTERDRLRRECNQVLSRLATLLEQSFEYAGAIRYAERLLAQDALQEATYQQLIRLHAANQDRASAVRVYNQCQKMLRRELGLDPGPVTRQLFERLLKSHESVTTSAVCAPPIVSSLSPLIDRDQERTRLMDTWLAAKRGRTIFALIEGEAGVGKSRLAEELLLHVSREGAMAVRTRCYSAQNYLAYAPVTDLLRAEPIRSALLELPQPQMTEVARILPELLWERPDISPPQPLAESWQRQHFLDALTAVFRQAASPLLVLIDDLQWCDQETLEWLYHYVCSQPTGEVLVLGTARPEELDRDHALSKLSRELLQSGHGVKLVLGPLDPAATGLLAKQLARAELDESYLSRLYAHTKGNALFIVESVRAHLEDPGLETLPVTPVIHAVVTARLANLSTSAYELAALASVLGRSFTFELLSAMSDLDENTLISALDELWVKRIVHGCGLNGYDFTHDVLRDVTYGVLTPVRRRALHLRVARTLEALHGGHLESISGQIAAHYEQAGLPEQAIPHLHRAAILAQQLYADKDAAKLLKRALALCRELPESGKRDETELELLVKLEHAQFTTLGYAAPEVGETNARAVQLVKKLGERRRLLNVLGGGWLFHSVRGRLDIARDCSQQFLEAAGEEGDSVLAAAHFIYGASLFVMGEAQPGRDHIERALMIHRDDCEPPLPVFSGPNVGVFARSHLSHILWYSGLPDRALRVSEESVAIARELKNPFSLAIAWTYAALLHLCRGDPEASACAEEAVALCAAHGFPYYLACASVVRAAAKARQRFDADDLIDLKRAVDSFKATGAELRLPLYHGLVAELCLKYGNTREGLVHVDTGLTHCQRNKEIWWNPELQRLQGDLLTQGGGDPAASLTCYRSALESAQCIGAKTAELHIATRLARLLIDQGRRAEARAVLEPIHTRWAEGFEMPDYQDASNVLEQTQNLGLAANMKQLNLRCA